jgi:hypothetical protein
MLWVDQKTKLVCIGIQPHVFEKHSRHQIQVMDSWCWAACVEIVATFLGFKGSSQAEIVEEAANGLQVNRAGHVDEVKTALENLGAQWNDRFQVNNAVSMILDAQTLTSQVLGDRVSEVLTKEMPLIALIGTNQGAGHFVVLTEIRYRAAPAKKYTQVVYYDPWPVDEKQGKAKGIMELWSLFCKKARYLIKVELS